MNKQHVKPYENASIRNKRFRRKANHEMLGTIGEMQDVITSSKHLEMVLLYYDSGGSYWWEIEEFRNQWEEIR